MNKIVPYPCVILKRKLNEVTIFDDDLKSLVDELYETMVEYDGIGLAANQINIDKAIAVIKNENSYFVIINPVINEYHGEKIKKSEACLSMKKVKSKVDRYESLTVTYQDIDGNTHTDKFDGILAHIIQHEIDHLYGIMYIDRLPYVKRKMVLDKYF